jgi:phage FluMu protein Com
MTGGKCRFCDEIFSKAGMERHLNKCPQRKAFEEAARGRKTRLFHIAVQGRYLPEYWMHLEVVADAKLKALDNFLRDVWLECCLHLSAFAIEGIRYVTTYNGSPLPESPLLGIFGVKDKDMNVKIAAVLQPGMRFIHEYDFGTTTELALKVLSEREGKPMNRPVQIMARNEPPTINCDKCGKPATQICTQCIYDDKGWLCDKCASHHKRHEEMLLPVVNSPRVGTCGYTGDGE